MKFAISLLFSFTTIASPINLYYEDKEQDAEIYKNIMVKNHNIPEDLIELKKESRCEEIKKRGKLDLCLKNNGDLYVVSVDRQFLDESLKVFQAP
jgi:hypothetical protein